MEHTVSSRELRRYFMSQLLAGLKVVWPIIIFLLSMMAALGFTIALLEHWKLFEGLYFAYVSGLTIGYGDFSPKTTVGRILAIGLGFLGILFTATVAAIAVEALNATRRKYHL